MTSPDAPTPRLPRRAAVIGCGKFREGKEGWAIGHSHAAGYLTADPQIELCGVDVDAENLQAFGKAFGIPGERLFASTADLYAAGVPDFVSICTWPRLHAPQVAEAAGHGVRGICCEKPLAMDPSEIREMVDVCTRQGVRLAVAHQRRLDPVFQRVREILRSGEIGEELVVEGRIGDGWDILSWTTHLFDMANFFFHAVPESILAAMDHHGTRRYGHAVEDASVVLAEYPDRRQALFVTGPDALGGALVQARGLGGMLVVHDRTIKVYSSQGYREEVIPHGEQAMAPVLRELIGAVETGSPMTCDVQHCAAATEMAYAAHESARSLRRVTVPPGVGYAPLEVVQGSASLDLGGGKAVLFADEHFGSGGREGIAAALGSLTKGTVDVVDAAREPLTLDRLEGAEILVIYHTQPEPDPETRSALTAWVEAGKPLAIVHAGLGAYPGWAEYAAWCGRVWSWDPAASSEHPYEPSRVRALAGLPVSWSEAMLPKDEVFIKLREVSACIDLASVGISSGTYPAAWTSATHPRIGVWVPGHRRDMWDVPALRDGFCALLKAVITRNS